MKVVTIVLCLHLFLLLILYLIVVRKKIVSLFYLIHKQINMGFKKIKSGKPILLQLKVNKKVNIKSIARKHYFITVLIVVAVPAILLAISLLTELRVPILKQLICWSIPKYIQDENEYIKGNGVVSCYYNFPDNQAPNSSQLMPLNIHPQLCTHINIAFAQIKNNQIYLEDSQYDVLYDIVKIKEDNPNLKLLLSVGGAGNHKGFSEMVINHAARKTFIRSIKGILRNYSLDGIDLDWEFPAVDMDLSSFKKRERQHFSQLLREIRAEYIREKRDYLLTVAAAAQKIIVDAAYDVDQINMFCDYVNIMTYDFHTYTKFTPFTGLNSPLYAKHDEELYFGTLNINYTVQMYKNKGLDPKKIVVGIPTYGHSYTLVNSNNNKIASPVLGFGSLGNSGFVNYPDICVFLRTYNNNATVKLDPEAKVPYLYKDTEWVSFDNTQSVIAKAKYIRDNKLRGAMIYSLNADDYDGACDKLSGPVKFPLSVSIKNALNERQAIVDSYCKANEFINFFSY